MRLLKKISLFSYNLPTSPLLGLGGVRRKSENVFITTPIYYVNSVPHIGHVYTTVLADACAKWEQMKSANVLFATGTDEYGIKIQKRAIKENIECKKFCDQISIQFRDLFDTCDIYYTDFIRTTEPRHRATVEHCWNQIMKNDWIYKNTYEGWYSVNDECHLKDSETETKLDANGKSIRVSIESGHEVERWQEVNYMFKLSKFKDSLRKYLSQNIIVPSKYVERLHHQIDTLEDLSVSRESNRVHWGIPVPNDPSQTIYVWFDALVNYLTVSGYPNNMSQFEQYWPPNIQVIGKDILRFHAIYWPSFLMACGLELPRKIYCHGHWLVDNRKMSKSIGNVIDPVACINKYTANGLRYFLLREGVPDSDCNVNMETFAKYINAELANTLGNLFQRSISFMNKFESFPAYSNLSESFSSNDLKFLDDLNSLGERCGADYDNFQFYLGIQKVMSQLRDANALFQEYEPWKLVKNITTDDSSRHKLEKLVYLIYEALRISSILLKPIVPSLANDLLDRLNVSANERRACDLNVCKSDKRRPCVKIDSKSTTLFKRIVK